MNLGGLAGALGVCRERLPMPPLSSVGGRGTGTVFGPRIAGALGCVPCMLLGLARRIGLLYGLLLPLFGRFCATSNGARSEGACAWARGPRTALKANRMKPKMHLFMGCLWTRAYKDFDSTLRPGFGFVNQNLNSKM